MLLGSGGNDVLTGNGSVDRLFGGLGNDRLTGGGGDDRFVFDTALNSTSNRDIILDFDPGDDVIQLQNSVFTKLSTGVLKTANFRVGTVAADANDYVIYNDTDGAVLYDADGNNSGAAIQIALIGNHVTLTNADFMIV